MTDVWLVWNARNKDEGDVACSSAPCVDGTVQLFSRKSDALAAKRALMLPAYYRVADEAFVNKAGKDKRDTGESDADDEWVKDPATGKWKSEAEDVLDEYHFGQIISRLKNKPIEPHMTMSSGRFDIDRTDAVDEPVAAAVTAATATATAAAAAAAAAASATASDTPNADPVASGTVSDTANADPAASVASVVSTHAESASGKRKVSDLSTEEGEAVWVAWFVTCDPEDSAHFTEFKVAASQSVAQAWFDRIGREHIQIEADHYDDVDPDNPLSAWLSRTAPDVNDVEGRFQQIDAFKRHHGIDVTHFFHRHIALVRIDATLPTSDLESDEPTDSKRAKHSA